MRILVAAAAGAAILLGAGIWLQRSLQVAWRAGYVAGERDLAASHRELTDRIRRAAAASAVQSGQRILELEKYSEGLQQRLAALDMALSGDPGRDRLCLDGDVLRTLARTGRDSPGPRTGSRQPAPQLRPPRSDNQQ